MSSVRNIDSNTFGDNAWIHQGDVIHHHAGNPHKPCVLIPFPRNEELIPRPDIISKLDELLPQSEEFFAAALYGLGGSGKTQIALDYAYRRSQVPTCSVFWVHADNETSFIQDFKLMAKRLGLPSNLDGDDLLMAVRYHIEANPPWVFILDNADNLTLFGVGYSAQDAMPGEHTSRLENFIPRGPRGQVLWTSRDERISGSIVGAQRAARVSNMTLDEARELFDSVRNKQASSAEAEAITALLAELDWLPLAISQSAAYIKKTMSTVEQYVSRLKEGKKRWKILKQSQTDRHRRREVSNSILETWNISMDYLRTENATSYQILHIHAFLDNQNIPVELIKQAALYSDGSSVMDHGHEAYDDDSSSDSDSDGDTINEAIVRLCDFSFLSIQDAGDGNRAYKVHKLVQEAMRYGLGRKEREKEEKYFSAAALEIIFNLFPENEESKPELWDECEKYITHAQKACEWAAVCGRELTAASLFDKLSDYLFDRGRWREREIVDQRAYELRKATLGDNHTDTIASTARLAVTYSNLGRYKEAERIEVEVLAQRREILGDRHDDTIWSMERLAVTYNDLGRYKEAEELQLEALAVRREIDGERHPDTIQSLVDLAATYYRLGRYEEAEQTHVQALALQREILGGRHLYTLKCMAGLGAVYHALGKYKEDKELSMEVLTLRQEILGEEHPDTIRSIAELGVTLRELGRYKKAEEMQVKALALRREILGEKHPDTIASMVDLAATYYSLYKYEEDERLSAEALALQREILGDDHPDTMDNMGKLAVTYRALRRDEEADELEMELSELQGS